MTTFEHRLDNSNKRRKYDHSDSGTLESVDPEVGWHLLQPILENDVLNAKIPTSSMAFDLLTKWFQIIVGDQDKLSLFRQWIKTSSEADDISPKKVAPSPTQSSSVVPLADIKKDDEEPVTPPPPPPPSSSSTPSDSPAPSITISTSPNKVASIDFINNEIPITPRSTPQVLLLQQLLQQQQKQIVLLQKLKAPSDAVVPTANTITLSSTSGSAGVVLTVNIKGSEWHAFSDTCSCTCGFTTADGIETTSNRIQGGNEGELRFVVPPISFPSPEVTQMPMTVHLTSCSAPHAPLVCVDSFVYGRERQSANSDSDSEDTPDSSVCDDEENDEDSEQSPVATSLSSPKQLMTIRERMMEFLQAPKGTARVVVVQQPPSRVVWKNRRLDTPFKVRVDGVQCDTAATKLAALALVVDHKNKLQIDAMENCEEECSPQGVALFHNLRMTKGTWGKEWSITFVMVVKSTMTTSAPIVVGVSQPCPVVVKTRKNPQVRHITRSDTARSDPPSPVAFVERKPDTTIRLKRNRVEDILDHPNQQSRTSSNSRPGLHSEAMSNLLYAAEIKQHEREFRVVHHPMPPTALSSSSSASPSPASSPSPPQSSLMLPSIQSSFVNPENNFANLQGLLGFLEEIKLKLHPSLVIIEQPQLKRDGKVLIVKKGKPFRTPFRLQMRVAQRGNFHAAPEYNPQQYVCVAVLRNDKGEEVALKNNEVSFDSRGLATFSGLMVMKGTWGKTVQLTFEARWSGARRIVGSNWPPLRMLVVAETPALQLMCYTKDKKTPSAV